MAESITGFYPKDMGEPASTHIRDVIATFTSSLREDAVEVDPFSYLTTKELETHRRKVEAIVEAQAAARREVFPVW